MLTTEFAVLLELHSVCVVALVLHGGVVAAFAGGASHRDNDSIFFLSHDLLLLELDAPFFERRPTKKRLSGVKAIVYLRYEIGVNKVWTSASYKSINYGAQAEDFRIYHAQSVDPAKHKRRINIS